MRNEDKFNPQQSQNNFQLTKKEIEDLLKKGAYGAIMEDDTVADKFCEEDIDKILQQRSTVIQIEGGEKGSTFSKASFQSTDTNEISIDDPEFWQKWAKKADIDVEEKLNPKDERIIYEPRRRTQTRRFGGPDDLLESDYSSSDTDDNDAAKLDANGNPIPGNDSKKHKRGKKSKRGQKNADANGANGGGANGNDNDADWNGGSNDAIYTDTDTGGGGVWSRDECYKVEKNLLIYGWSRWTKILQHCDFSSRKKGGIQTEQDVENLSRTIIAYALKNYHGDESIKQFMIELIDPAKSNFADLKNHHGLAAPVGRTKKSNKNKSNTNANTKNVSDTTTTATTTTTAVAKDEEEVKVDVENLEQDETEKPEENAATNSGEETKKTDTETKDKDVLQPPPNENTGGEQPIANIFDLEWAKNAEELLGDENYKKHLIRQANRILLRLRQLFYIKHEIIGDENAAKIDEDELKQLQQLQQNEASSSPLPDLQLPEVLADMPAEWWDRTCDVCMFVGVYKHGYEKYSLMRLDPKLCFLQICGPPDAQDLLAEQQQQQDNEANDDNNDTAVLDIDDTISSTVASTTAPTTPASKGILQYLFT
jgi:chromodomain-helicase-DNA-binding protein 7